MATIKQVKGITAKRTKPIVVPLPYAPENQHISRDEFIRRRELQNKAKAAADAAYQKVLAEQSKEEAIATPASDEKVAKLRQKLARAEEKLQENPNSKVWQKKLQEISEELEIAEAELG